VITLPARALATGGRLAVVAAAGALVLAGCSSSSPSKITATSAPPAASSAPAASAKNATVETHKGDLGTYLTDGTGRSLYLFASDTAGKSSCSDSCTTYWPPLITAAAPAATGGATASMLGTITRSDGSKQVTYSGHPLYYFLKDSSPGDVKGQGNDAFGAKWWIVSPAGQSITTTGAISAPASSASSSSDTGGGGGGYG
jgi:predicted lipoprotein with Yx(FWY)xxD motif